MRKRFAGLNIVIVGCMVLLIVLLAVHSTALYRDNHKVYTAVGNDSTSPVYMDIDFRKDATSKWLKRDFNLYGETVDLTGATIDEILYNNSDYSLRDWTLRINIRDDCFINQAWNGQVEIHQYVGTGNEVVQLVSLQNYKIEDIAFDYLYDGDLLIPLQAGDYVIYYPSDQFSERTLDHDSKLTIGVIFYYLESIDLSDYQLDYAYHREFAQGTLYYIIIVLFFVLFTCIIVAYSMVFTYTTARREQDQQKAAVSCMSDIYQIIYLINLENDELIPVSADTASEKLRPKGKGAREQLLSMFVWDAEENYQEIMNEFSDLSTVADRLKNKNSIACEYLSKHYGWCSIRIFRMGSGDGEAPKQVLFTIQVIDDEKRELENIKARASQAETNSQVQTVILNRLSNEIRKPLTDMEDCSAKLLEVCADSTALAYAEKIRSGSGLLLTMFDGIIDYSHLRSGRMELKSESYSLKRTMEDAYRIAGTVAQNRGLTMKLNLADNIPDQVRGDSVRLKQTIVFLVTHMAKCTEAGEIKLTMYGKTVGDRLHLLTSVLSEGTILSEKTAENAPAGSDIDLSIASGILERMDSRLKVVSGNDGIYELYFEMDQDLA